MRQLKHHDAEELSDLLYTATREGLCGAVWHMRGHLQDENVKKFLTDYKAFYLSNKNPSPEFCAQASGYVTAALAADPDCLNKPAVQWSTGIASVLAAATPFIAYSQNAWYGLGTAIIAGIAYLSRMVFKKASRDDSNMIQTAIALEPRVLAQSLNESREYMGEELIECGMLNRDELPQYRPRKPRRQRKHEAKI